MSTGLAEREAGRREVSERLRHRHARLGVRPREASDVEEKKMKQEQNRKRREAKALGQPYPPLGQVTRVGTPRPCWQG